MSERPARGRAPKSEASSEEALARSLRAVRRVYDVEQLLDEAIRPESVSAYYRQSLPGYLAIHNSAGAIHFALDGSDFAAQPRIVERMLQSIDARRVLELASGTGFNADLLARALPRTHFSGIDLMPAHLRAARLRTRRLPNVRFEHADLHELPHPAGAFDAAYSVEGFCYANRLDTALGEVRRVVRPGGRFIVVDGFLRQPLRQLSDHARTAVRLFDSVQALSRTWTLDDFLRRGAQHDLHLVGVEDLTERVVENAERLAHIAHRFFRRPRFARLANTVLPPRLVRNSIVGALTPSLLTSAYGYYAVTLCRGSTPVRDRRSRVSIS